MATSEILPVEPGVPWQRFQVVLDGQTYTLEFRWNGRDAAWYLSILSADGQTMILPGRKLALGAPIVYRFARSNLPLGEIELFDTTGSNQEAGLDDLGERVLVLYIPGA